MRDGNQIHPVILQAVTKELVAAEQELASCNLEVERALAAHQNAQMARDRAEENRANCASFLALHTADTPDLVHTGASVSVRPWNLMPGVGKSLTLRSVKHDVVTLAKEFLEGGQRMRSDEIFQRLVAAGVQISADNGPRRVTQILSDSGEFDPDRIRGWGLPQLPDEVEARREKEEESS